jgi:hypothetical protein
MDDRRFDDLTRHLVGIRSRRRVLVFLGATLASGLFGRARLAPAVAQEAPCPPNAPCTFINCGAATGCYGCSQGFKCCTVPAECGATSTCLPNDVCCEDSDCASGGCTTKTGAACPAGLEKCSDNCCHDTNTDPANCGSCGHACPGPANASPTCARGQCGFRCNPGFADCNANPTDGCEVNTDADPNNCGGRGHVCPPPAAAIIASTRKATSITAAAAATAARTSLPWTASTVSAGAPPGGSNVSIHR